MSAAQHDATITVRRSELACPAHSLKMMARAAAGDADELVFDLEDGCAPSQKAPARKTLIEALTTLDFHGKIRAFRPNGIHTKFFYRDVIELVEAAGSRIDVVVLPKVQDAADVLFADRLLTQIEQNVDLPRLAALIFGVVDYAGSIGARDPVREQFALYHYPKAKTVAAARAAGIDVVDGVTLQFRDLQQCEHDARSAAQMGFDGKWAIHPDQVPAINRAFTPSPEEISRAREIIDLYEKADVNSGLGAVVYKDEMVDAASLPIERKKLAIAKKTRLL
jgi:citrate lyase subunit beta/citryl-CoA lyase